MGDELDRRIDAYLEGELDVEDTRRLERELLRPEVSRLLGEELLVRSYLRELGPEAPPPGLCERLEAALAVQARGAAAAEREPRFAVARAALGGFGWALRGPALAVSRGGAEAAVSGLGTMRHALGPLGMVARAGRPAPKPTPWWRWAARKVF